MPGKSRKCTDSFGPKHRQAILDHWRVETLRSGTDQIALEQIRQRAIHDPDVRNDPQLAAQVERCISERSSEITRMRGQRSATASQIHPAHFSQFAAYEPSPDDIRKTAKHLHMQAQDQIARNDEIAAGFTVERLRTLFRDYPEALDETAFRTILDLHEALKARRRNVAREIKALEDKATAAAAAGDHDATAASMRQLAAYHIAHPELLSDESMDAIRERVLVVGAHRQHEQAARELMSREREVSEELRQLRTAIQAYRRAALADPHDSTAHRSAERAFHKAVREIRHHDREWLAATILELVGLLDDWEDHPKSADKQVEAFIGTLKSTLKELHAELRSTVKAHAG